MEEEQRPVIWHRNYVVSRSGRVFNKVTGRNLKEHIDRGGYSVIRFPGGLKSLSRTVAIAFVPNTMNHPQVNHKDGNKQNNCASNLEWCTAKHNSNHRDKMFGNPARGKPAATRRMVNQFTKDGIFIRSFKSLLDADKATGCDFRNIQSVASGRRSFAGGFKWTYA